MTSRGYILGICWISMVLHWTTDMFPGGIIPSVFCAAWLIMEFTGMFKKELAGSKPEEKDERSQRQIDFQRKLEDGKNGIFEDDDDGPPIEARIYTVDDDGNESFVIIKADGTVETEGNPDPDIVEAVSNMKEAIQKHGPGVIAEELTKQLDKINKEKP